MLVKITDRKGRDWHINPMYIKNIREKKPGRTEVLGSFMGMGSALQTDEPAADLADRVSVALASMGGAAFGAVESERQQQQQSAAAAGAVAG
jgi:hypothetical protein